MSDITSISLSNDSSSFAICYLNTFHVYSTHPIKRKYQKEFPKSKLRNISTTSDGTFVAFVAKNKEVSTVYLWNNFYGECHCKIEFRANVTNILLTPQLMLIALDDSFCIYNIQTKSMQLEQKTYENPKGAADLCTSSDGLLLAVCGKQMGYVQVLEYGSVNPPINFQAAKHPITQLKFSPDSSLLATASEKGTLIRIFDSMTGTALCIFRRGALTSSILSMSFSPNNHHLIAVSENGTIHLFPADARNANQNDPPRAIAKFKIDKSSLISSSFRSENELIVLAGTGHIYLVDCSQGTLDLVKKSLAFEI
ncbi:WD repeat domain phosphoinositide-interacting protein 3-like protein [Tritrichomonas foetus]|uniref:WD repeat domain phosphoinositide-interacting protein 3-like protein n=1 Tax=Tritrichomonas foetus TaxID=1144522 RepID=A0A1J4JWA1_9EUKA|nr:WD repeat domain phosphoinositide-interacting protein 3-like protein [Tritrichomonas foetus]|eukprot:OHT01804.1 WD repeat domain phosphoinositide-interacting protein 3-like protein [Tritrichomonas foetus]